MDSLHREIVARFGSGTAEARDIAPNRVLLLRGWQDAPDGTLKSSDDEMETVVKCPDGQYRLDLTLVYADRDDNQSSTEVMTGCQTMLDLLKKNPRMTLEELKAAMKAQLQE
jgi:hypothetical protein